MRLRTWAKLYASSPRRALAMTPALLRPVRNNGKRRIYINAEGMADRGPHVFVRRFTSELERFGIEVSHSDLRGCSAALMLVSTWGDTFYEIANRLKMKTVLRVDGFYLPVYFDNREQPGHYQSRKLAYDLMLLNQQMQRDLLLADHVVFQSKFSKDMCDLYLYNRRHNFSIIHNGVDTEVFKPVETEARPLTLLSAGNLRHEYMLGTVVPVFYALKDKCDLRLLIIGTMDKVNRQFFEDYRNKNAEEFERRVTYLGPLKNEELPYWFNQADILVHPRAGDWSPNVVAEALACGLPVVCPKWGGASEMIGEGGVAVEVEPWDYSQTFIDKMVEGVQRVIDDLDEYKSKAREQAVNNLGVDIMARKYMECLFN